MNAKEAINELHSMPDKEKGYFMVGTNPQGEVVINCEKVTTDKDGNCFFILSPQKGQGSA